MAPPVPSLEARPASAEPGCAADGAAQRVSTDAVVGEGPSGTGATGTWGHSLAGESGFVGVRPGFLVVLSAHIEVEAKHQSDGDGQQPVPGGAPHRNGLSSSRVNNSAEPRLAPRAAQLRCWMLLVMASSLRIGSNSIACHRGLPEEGSNPEPAPWASEVVAVNAV